MESRVLLWITFLLLWLGAGWAWGQRERVLARCRSAFNEVKVVQEGYERLLKVRQGKVFVEESRCDMRRPAHLLHQYSRLQMLGTLYPRKLEKALVVGLGGGSLSKALALQFPRLHIDSLELDPEIANLARKYFGYREDERSRCIVTDARDYLKQTSAHYDLIVLDAFDGLEIPQPLRTVQFYQLVRQRLNPGGVAVSNLHRVSQTYPRDRASLAAVFAHAVAFEGTGLVVVVSGQEEFVENLSRWQESWGFPLEPLLKLRQERPDFSPSSEPFMD